MKKEKRGEKPFSSTRPTKTFPSINKKKNRPERRKKSVWSERKKTPGSLRKHPSIISGHGGKKKRATIRTWGKGPTKGGGKAHENGRKKIEEDNPNLDQERYVVLHTIRRKGCPGFSGRKKKVRHEKKAARNNIAPSKASQKGMSANEKKFRKGGGEV